MNRNNLKIFSWFSFASMSLVFFSLLFEQDKKVNPDRKMNELLKENVFLLNNWDLKLFDCKSYFPKNCDETSVLSGVNLPSVRANQWVSENSGKLVVATHQINSEILDWAEKKSIFSIVVPKQMAQRVTLLSPVKRKSATQLVDSSFEVSHKQLLSTKKIVLEFDFRGFDRFGPADIPMVLSSLNTVRSWVDITNHRDTEALLSRQLHIGLPLVLAAMSIVVDHVDGFRFMSIFASVFGLRTFLYTLDRSQDWTLLIFLLNLVYLPTLLIAALRIIRIRFNQKYLKYSIVASCLIQCAAYFGFGNYHFYSDVITDLGGSVFVLVSIIILAKYYEQREDENRYEHPLALIIVIFGLLGSLISNTEDLFLILNGYAKNFTSWGHFVLVPALAVASLIKVGPMLKFINRERRKAKENAERLKEVQLGREAVDLELPPSKGSFASVRWRNFRWPCLTLAGDVHDIRGIDLSDGRKLIAFIVVDVRGHGIGAALYVNSVLSGYRYWLSGLDYSLISKMTKEECVAEAPSRIAASLDMLNEKRGMTAMIGLVDPESKELTYCLAGHHGFFVDGESVDIEYHFNQSSSIDFVGGETWEAHTVSLPQKFRIVSFTDGIFEPGESLNRWIYKTVRSKEKNIPYEIVNKMRRNKKVFRNDRSLEDDMTMVLIESI